MPGNPAGKKEVFGGPNGGGNNFKNYDKVSNTGIVDDVNNFSKHYGQSSVDEIVANNPMAPFLTQVESAMVSGGTITVRGTMSNKFFNSIWKGGADGMSNFKVIGKKEGVANPGYMRNDGTPVQGTINEIVLQKL